MEQIKDYTILPDKEHKKDLRLAKIEWKISLEKKGISRKTYKYKTVLKVTQ